jgi:branched-chain amino acid transport system permease protein
MSTLSTIKDTGKAFYQKYKLLIWIVASVFILLMPVIFPKNYIMGVMCRILMYTTLAGGLNAINGYSGQTCIGIAGFFCVGAYTEAILATRFELSFWIILPLAGILTAIVGLLVATPTLRMSGIYLSIVTLGFSEIMRLIALNWTDVTGGAMGIKGIPSPVFFGISLKNSKVYYYVFLALAILFLFTTSRVLKSRVGRAWMSIREGEIAARSLGVETSRYKAMNFMYGAFWAGIAGAAYAPYVKFLDSTYFTLDEGWNVLSMVIIGGQGTLGGPIVGSIIVNFLTEVLRPIGQWRLVAFGIVIIVMLWFRPQGLVGASNSILSGHDIVRKISQASADDQKTETEAAT